MGKVMLPVPKPPDMEGMTLEEKIEEAAVPVSLSLMEGGKKLERKRGPKWEEGESLMTGSENKRKGMEALIEWHVTPESERLPKTKQGLADLLGVTSRTLRNWEKESYVQRQISNKIRNEAKVQKAPAVLAALYDTATNAESSRQVAAAKVWLEWIDRKTDDISAEDLAEMSDDELLETIGDLHDLIEARGE